MVFRNRTSFSSGGILLVMALILGFNAASYAQGRKHIKDSIQRWGECRNVAITKTNGDLALYGQNGCARQGLPQSLNDAIEKLNKEGAYIDDIQLTESGSWLILHGDNGFTWNDIPSSLEDKLRQYNDDGEVVLSVTFNDAGDWVIISKDYFTSSDEAINSWLKQGLEEFGQLWAACVTDDAIVAVYKGGYKFGGEVPLSLKTALQNTSLDVFRLKIAGSSWFFADTEGHYEYNM
jgi:hypothetical protein